MKTDCELVIEFKKGDETAFDELIKRYRAPLLSFLGGRDEAYDLVQETFKKAYNKIHTFNEAYSFKCWIYKIARNCQIDACRRENKRQSVMAVLQEDDSTSSPPFAGLLQSEYKNLVRNCIDDLSIMQREVLIMSYYHGLKYKQIAEILDCSVSAVKTHMSRAVYRLSQSLPTPEEGDF